MDAREAKRAGANKMRFDQVSLSSTRRTLGASDVLSDKRLCGLDTLGVLVLLVVREWQCMKPNRNAHRHAGVCNCHKRLVV